MNQKLDRKHTIWKLSFQKWYVISVINNFDRSFFPETWSIFALYVHVDRLVICVCKSTNAVKYSCKLDCFFGVFLASNNWYCLSPLFRRYQKGSSGVIILNVCQAVKNDQITGDSYCCDKPSTPVLHGYLFDAVQEHCDPPCAAVCNDPDNPTITGTNYCCPPPSIPILLPIISNSPLLKTGNL